MAVKDLKTVPFRPQERASCGNSVFLSGLRPGTGACGRPRPQEPARQQPRAMTIAPPLRPLRLGRPARCMFTLQTRGHFHERHKCSCRETGAPSPSVRGKRRRPRGFSQTSDAPEPREAVAVNVRIAECSFRCVKNSRASHFKIVVFEVSQTP